MHQIHTGRAPQYLAHSVQSVAESCRAVCAKLAIISTVCIAFITVLCANDELFAGTKFPVLISNFVL